MSKFWAFLFPRRCFGCGQVGEFLCFTCQESVHYPEAQVCPGCWRPAVDGFTHRRCRKPLTADRSICLYRYAGPLKDLIHAIKYDGVRGAGDFIVDQLVAPAWRDWDISLGERALLLPVPIHPVRRLARGFNQAELLVDGLGRLWGLEVWTDFLKKVRDNVSQTGLKRESRRQNVRGAYRVEEKDPRRDCLRGRDVVIVDDVMTSGATLAECARVVKRTGARFVYLLALAKD